MSIRVSEAEKRIEIESEESMKDKIIALIYKIIRKYGGDLDWEPKGKNIVIYYYAPNQKALEKAREKLEKALTQK